MARIEPGERPRERLDRHATPQEAVEGKSGASAAFPVLALGRDGLGGIKPHVSE